MLDDNRKRFLRNVSIKSIKPNGVLWVFGEQVRTYQLTKEDIRYLRWYHNNPNIAYQVDCRMEPKTYQVAKDRNKYNHNTRTKKRVNTKGIGKLIIVGSLTISLVVGGIFLANRPKGDNTEMTSHEVSMQTMLSGTEEEYPIETSTLSYNDEDVRRVELIKHLCDIYQVDYATTYRVIKEITEDFSAPEYLDGRCIGITCKGVEVQASSEEELLVYIVRAIKQVPQRFGLDESIHIHNGYNSGTDYYAQISDVCEVLGVDRNLMYAIVRSETGFNSELFNNSNNPAGLRGVNGVDEWWQFDTKEEGFLEFGMELLKYYRKLGISPNDISPETIKAIGNIHAPVSDGNDNWLPNVLSCLEYAQSNEYQLFGGEEVHGLGR